MVPLNLLNSFFLLAICSLDSYPIFSRSIVLYTSRERLSQELQRRPTQMVSMPNNHRSCRCHTSSHKAALMFLLTLHLSTLRL